MRSPPAAGPLTPPPALRLDWDSDHSRSTTPPWRAL